MKIYMYYVIYLLKIHMYYEICVYGDIHVLCNMATCRHTCIITKVKSKKRISRGTDKSRLAPAYS